MFLRIIRCTCYIAFSLTPNRSQTNLQMYKTTKIITTELYYHHYTILVIKYQVSICYIHFLKLNIQWRALYMLFLNSDFISHIFKWHNNLRSLLRIKVNNLIVSKPTVLVMLLDALCATHPFCSAVGPKTASHNYILDTVL